MFIFLLQNKNFRRKIHLQWNLLGRSLLAGKMDDMNSFLQLTVYVHYVNAHSVSLKCWIFPEMLSIFNKLERDFVCFIVSRSILLLFNNIIIRIVIKKFKWGCVYTKPEEKQQKIGCPSVEHLSDAFNESFPIRLKHTTFHHPYSTYQYLYHVQFGQEHSTNFRLKSTTILSNWRFSFSKLKPYTNTHSPCTHCVHIVHRPACKQEVD